MEGLLHKRKAVLDRLEGRENPLAAGFKVLAHPRSHLICTIDPGLPDDRRGVLRQFSTAQAVDDHVGLLAEGVAGLAGTLWGSARTASTHVAVHVCNPFHNI